MLKISRKWKAFFSAQRADTCPAEIAIIVYCYTHSLQPHGGHVQSCNGPPLKFIFFYLSPGWWLATSIELDKGDLVFLVEYINSCRAGGPKWPWPKGAKLNVRGTLRKKMSTPCLLPNNNHQPVFAIYRLKRSKTIYHTLAALILGKAGQDSTLLPSFTSYFMLYDCRSIYSTSYYRIFEIVVSITVMAVRHYLVSLHTTQQKLLSELASCFDVLL